MSFQEIYDEATYKEPLEIPNDGDWCSTQGVPVIQKKFWKKCDKRMERLLKLYGGISFGHAQVYVRPKKVRCPKCGRRLTPKSIDTEPFNSYPDIELRIPRHKVKHKDRIKNQKARKKTGDKGFKR